MIYVLLAQSLVYFARHGGLVVVVGVSVFHNRVIFLIIQWIIGSQILLKCLCQTCIQIYLMFCFVLMHLRLFKLLDKLVFQKSFVLLQNVLIVTCHLKIALAIVILGRVLKSLSFLLNSCSFRCILFSATKHQPRPLNSRIQILIL